MAIAIDRYQPAFVQFHGVRYIWEDVLDIDVGGSHTLALQLETTFFWGVHVVFRHLLLSTLRLPGAPSAFLLLGGRAGLSVGSNSACVATTHPLPKPTLGGGRGAVSGGVCVALVSVDNVLHPRTGGVVTE